MIANRNRTHLDSTVSLSASMPPRACGKLRRRSHELPLRRTADDRGQASAVHACHMAFQYFVQIRRSIIDSLGQVSFVMPAILAVYLTPYIDERVYRQGRSWRK